MVSGGNGGIVLEMAMALLEAGARTVYCVDIADRPGERWTKVRDFVGRVGLGKLEYVAADVSEQVSAGGVVTPSLR